MPKGAALFSLAKDHTLGLCTNMALRIKQSWALTSVWPRVGGAAPTGGREMEAGGGKKSGDRVTMSHKTKRAAGIKCFSSAGALTPISLAMKFQ